MSRGAPHCQLINGAIHYIESLCRVSRTQLPDINAADDVINQPYSSVGGPRTRFK